VKAGINAMVATGDTYSNLGLMWGWHTVSPNAPFADGAAYGGQVQKIIVLMTDARTPFTTTPPQRLALLRGRFHLAGTVRDTAGTAAERRAALDARMDEGRTNLKAKGITLYTIRVEVTAARATRCGSARATPPSSSTSPPLLSWTRRSRHRRRPAEPAHRALSPPGGDFAAEHRGGRSDVGGGACCGDTMEAAAPHAEAGRRRALLLINPASGVARRPCRWRCASWRRGPACPSRRAGTREEVGGLIAAAAAEWTASWWAAATAR
jgi:hypothetical protein